MDDTISKTKIDQLGERLKVAITDDDLRLLDLVRRSFSPGYEFVMAHLRGPLGFEPTGRPAKSTSSIVDKLQRETIRLSQMQDIAGCRIIVPDARMQDTSLGTLISHFPDATVVDRRYKPSHGYRAIHIIPMVSGRPIEIQLRTALQHVWAELSEKYSDVVDAAVKYGGGPAEIQGLLLSASGLIEQLEEDELEPGDVPRRTLELAKAGIRKIIEDVRDQLLTE